MQSRQFDAIVVMGHATENYALNYMTNGAALTEGIVVKKRDEAPVLICGSMEREEAAKSGLTIETFNDYNLFQLAQEEGSIFEARLKMMVAIFERHGLQGKVSFYGLGDPGQSYVMLTRLSQMLPDITITGETETSIFDEAFTTKDGDELTALRSVAERTNQVMAETVDFVKGHRVKDSRLVKDDDSPLTVGDVKQYVRMRLIYHRLEEADGMIFAVGRDGGVPHSRGEDSDVLELGRCIVFDLFPRDLGGGYFHDMTRTFCLGYAPPEIQHAYDQVRMTFDEVMKALAIGEKAARYQELTCELLEEMGHPTIRSNSNTQEGYVHSLGHGLGLQIHARPRLSPVSTETVQPGQVFTVEPGLYYPSKGYGVRIEDTVYADRDGTFHSLTPFPKDLVIPVGENQE
jgi:Xaa-Pro aminopeptidase